IATQGIAVATGLQDKFNGGGVAAAAAVSGVSGQIKVGGIPGQLLSGAAGALAGAATRSVLDGSDFGDNVLTTLPDVLGSTIGNLVAGVATSGFDAPSTRSNGQSEAARPPRNYWRQFGAGGYETDEPAVVITGTGHPSLWQRLG